MARFLVGDVPIGDKLVLIAGPCVLEENERMKRLVDGLVTTTVHAGVPFIFKASFDKANRTARDSRRGPGLHEGLQQLSDLKAQFGMPITTDVHESHQAAAVAEVADLLQVPAFLCRQTDLLLACAATGRPVNVKKGPFLSPEATGPLVAKLEGAAGVMVTERGTTFGHGDLVVDFRGLVTMRKHAPVCFDCTHSTQRPSALGDRSGGNVEMALPLARAAVAVGIDALFAEVHDNPAEALSDAATQLPLAGFAAFLERVLACNRG